MAAKKKKPAKKSAQILNRNTRRLLEGVEAGGVLPKKKKPSTKR